MTLTPGTQLGPYEILSLLGQGGMGEVYRARDPRLGRDVAIKVSHEQFNERFEREARVVASLNHTNICHLYDVGPNYLVMELVEGETLRGPVPLDEALKIARQIADALEAAHEKGVIHRDLKPANIKITPDGVVKVLDFGLARIGAVDSVDPGNSPTTIGSPTRLGMILGTAAYMAPEQARGKVVDKRADIWAFGVVLYEILTGKQMFTGETVTDILAGVLTTEPDLSLVPARVRRLIARCLEKDPKKRLRDIGDYWQLIEEEKSGTEVPPQAKARATWLYVALGVALAALAVLAFVHFPETSTMVWTGDLLGGTEVALQPRVSPDGHTVAFVGLVNDVTQLGVMKPETGDYAMLTRKTENGYIQSPPSWAPDGARIFFDRWDTTIPRGIFSVPLLGGEEKLVLEDASQPEPLADGSLLAFRQNAQHQTQLFRFWPDTGRLQGLPIQVENSLTNNNLRAFPGGHEAVILGIPIAAGGDTTSHLYVVNLDSGTLRRLAPGTIDESTITNAAPSADGKTVLVANVAGSLFTRISAIPVRGNTPLRTLFTLTRQVWSIDSGPDGSVYVDQVSRQANLLRFSPEGGKTERLATYPSPGFALETLAVLPDGRAVLAEPSGGQMRLMIVEAGKDPVRLANTQEETSGPVTPVRASEAAFLIGPVSRRVIAIVNVANGRITRRISFDKGSIRALAASPDGKTLYAAASGTVWSIAVSGESSPKKIRAGDAVAADPNGQFLLVESIETPAIRLVRVPLNGGPEQEIPAMGAFSPANLIIPGGVDKEGRILTPLGTLTFFWPPGMVDSRTGRWTRIAVDDSLDYHQMTWTPDGKILALALDQQATMWKFRATPDR